ncbi:tRNA pseudouridine(54/55) synthase Pus10 [Methanobrevibacter sp. 87.7]|uniref:tRNA pseudouridine(54/55) synthase Pus10 n=1 Tax=Methanobrevibacter sp. 87.7 TaxID=387957 RepID=UPI000B506313|nr:tRNA pseudouridine(54/55) synthase Pus10 [Methanobrevibacter sp. 87.7]OWT33546.1 tRNA pseudouridine(54/55) synthase Pus10 [Methanobrevibacter sp. 87.7]
MDEELLKKAEEIIEYTDNTICNHCLGRKFSNEIKGLTNKERGELIRKELSIENPNEKCFICDNIFDKINEDLYKRINQKIQFINLEFDNFLVGSKVPKEILKKDEEFNEKFNIDTENIKKEINRTIGLELEKIGKIVEFDHNEIVIELNFKNNEPTVYIQINPLFIEGTYNKYKRGIPQTKWPCRECHGKGCEYCNYTGKMYPESVEELMSEVVLKETQGRYCKFHGAGREDIDVLMLGDGRPFVLEVIEPKIRKLDLNKLEKEINEHANGKTKYNHLKYCKRNRKSEIKVSSPDAYKVYEAIVNCENEVTDKDLEILQNLDLIKQRTPIRVAHRRADKIREKRVLGLSCEIISPKQFKMKIKTEGGLYIKELISSDEGRSNPSVTGLLNNQCICSQLDVIEVSKK